MRIAVITEKFPKLSETFVSDQISLLVQLGYHVDIYALFPSDESSIHDEVTRFGLNKKTTYLKMPRSQVKRLIKALKIVVKFKGNYIHLLKSLNFLRYRIDAISLKTLYLLTAVEGKKYDFVHVHFGNNGMLGVFLKDLGYAKECYVSFHGADANKLKTAAELDYLKTLFKSDVKFVSNSIFMKKKLVSLGCNNNNIMVLPYCIDLDKFNYFERDLNEEVKFISVGRLVEKKGHIYVLQALKKIVEKYNNIKYLIVGDGPQKRSLENYCNKVNLNKNVTFLGSKKSDEVKQLLKSSSVFILNSITAEDGDMEGLPVVILEAQASGLPILSTYHAGIPEMVSNGVEGLLVEEKNVEEIYKSMKFFIENKNDWNRMGKNGFSNISKNYSLDIMKNRFQEIFR